MANRKLRVYGWQGMRSEYNNPEHPWSHQTREIVAATSKAEVARIAGVRSPRALWNLTETGNEPEIAAALAKPGTILWRGLDEYGPNVVFREAGRV